MRRRLAPIDARVARPLATAMVLAVACGACSTVLGLRDGHLEADAGDAGDAEGASDAPAFDAGDGADAQRWCASYADAALCADFDEGDLRQGWSTLELADGGSLRLDTTRPRSPPASLLAALPAAPGVGGTCRLGYVFSGKPTLVNVAFDMHLATALVADGTFGEFSLVSKGPSEYHLFTMKLRDQQLSVEEVVGAAEGGATSTSHAAGIKGALDAWSRISMRVTLASAGDGGTSGSVSVSVDGVVTLEDTPILSTPWSGTAKFTLGTARAASDVSFAYDDVVLDAR